MSGADKIVAGLHRLRPDPFGRDDATARGSPLPDEALTNRRLGARAYGEERASVLARVLADIRSLGAGEVAERGAELLISAVMYKLAECVGALVAVGVEPDAMTRDGFTSLTVACRRGDLASMHVLLEAGANPALRDSVGRSPLAFAATSNRPESAEAVRRLLDAVWHEPAERRKAVLEAASLACGPDAPAVRAMLWADARIDPRLDRTRAKSVRCNARPGPTTGTAALWRMNSDDPSWIVLSMDGKWHDVLSVLRARRPNWTLHEQIHKNGIWAGAAEVLVFSFADDPWILIVTETGDVTTDALRAAHDELQALMSAGARRGVLLCAKDGEEALSTLPRDEDFSKSASESIDDFLQRNEIRVPGIRIALDEGRIVAVLSGKENCDRIRSASALVLYPS